MALISSVFSRFFCKHEKPAARARTRERATKNPARRAARAPGVVSVNTLFWKILVTRVKRKIELPLSPSISSGSRSSRRAQYPQRITPIDPRAPVTMASVSKAFVFSAAARPDHRNQRARGLLQPPPARAHEAIPEPDSAVNPLLRRRL